MKIGSSSIGGRVVVAAAVSWAAYASGAAASGDAGADDRLCGLYTLHVAANGLDHPVTMRQLRGALGEPSESGYSLEQLAFAAEELGLYADPVVTTFRRLRARRAAGQQFACIAHVDSMPTGTTATEGHFVLLGAVEDSGRVWVIDPPNESTVPIDTFAPRWRGQALLISGEPLIAESDLDRATPWGWRAVGSVGLVLIVLSAAAWLLFRSKSERLAALLVASMPLFGGCGTQSDAPTDDDRPGGASAEGSRPEVSFGRRIVDLGQVAAGPVGHAVSFPVVNRGDATLEFRGLVKNCGCVRAEVRPGASLEPGGRGQVLVTVSSRTAEDREAVLNVLTNDPDRPKVSLRVIWKAVSPRWVEPSTLDFGRVRPGERKTLLLKLPTASAAVGFDDASPGQVGAATVSHPDVLKAAPADVADEDVIRVTLTAPDRPGSGWGRVTVPLHSGFCERLTASAVWVVREPIEILPPALFLGSVEPGATVRRRVSVVASGPFEAGAVTLDTDDGAGWAVTGGRARRREVGRGGHGAVGRSGPDSPECDRAGGYGTAGSFRGQIGRR